MDLAQDEGGSRDEDDLFVVPSFEHAIDLGRELARIPADATTKGLYLNALKRLADEHGTKVTTNRYVGMLDYPNREFTQLAIDVALLLHPDVPPREALRRLGHLAFPELRSSMIGRAVFGVLAGNLPQLFRLVSRAWRMSTSHVRAELIGASDNHALVDVSECHALMDSYVVGIFEGIILDAAKTPAVTIHLLTETRGRFMCRW